ncbi:MAG: LuxR C-terminal-related transcriptional regulator [Jiangellaceae bacterium]
MVGTSGADDRPAAVDVAGELARGRAAADELAWARAYESLSWASRAGHPEPGDLHLLATAAFLVGRLDDCLYALQRAHQGYVETGDARQAARCLFWLGFILLLGGDHAQAAGWLGRAGRLLEGEQESGEHGLLLLPTVIQEADTGAHGEAVATASRMVEIGTRTGDAEVLALGLHWKGRALVRQGRMSEGLALLDESMTAVVAAEVAPYVAGSLYCSMIDTCREIADVRRAHEWTDALTMWCDQQPDMFTFSGQCLVHRAEIMQLHGRWPEAVQEARRACDRFDRAADQYSAGAAWYRLGEIYRMQGAAAQAEEAYRRAGEWGHEPQPGLALLRLAAGRTEVAKVALERALAEAGDRPRRAALLPALVEIALASEDHSAAEAAAAELAEIIGDYDTPALRAAAAHARGAVQLAAGDARQGLSALRTSWELWRELDAPYDAARVRVLIGLGCRSLGDEDAAELELAAARRVFLQLGAQPDAERVDSLTRPGPGPEVAHRLTARELEVLRLLAAGKTNRMIAAELVLADKTVDRHVSNIFSKINVTSRAAATGYAHRHGLV